MITSNHAEIEVTEWAGSDEETPSYHMQFSGDVRKKLNYIDDIQNGFWSGNDLVNTVRMLEREMFAMQDRQRETERLIANNPAVREAYDNFKIMAALAAEEAQ